MNKPAAELGNLQTLPQKKSTRMPSAVAEQEKKSCKMLSAVAEQQNMISEMLLTLAEQSRNSTHQQSAVAQQENASPLNIKEQPKSPADKHK